MLAATPAFAAVERTRSVELYGVAAHHIYCLAERPARFIPAAIHGQ
jgi:hypothetical protein